MGWEVRSQQGQEAAPGDRPQEQELRPGQRGQLRAWELHRPRRTNQLELEKLEKVGPESKEGRSGRRFCKSLRGSFTHRLPTLMSCVFPKEARPHLKGRWRLTRRSKLGRVTIN